MSERPAEGWIDQAAELSFELICRNVLSAPFACYYPFLLSDIHTSLTPLHVCCT